MSPLATNVPPPAGVCHSSWTSGHWPAGCCAVAAATGFAVTEPV